MKVLFIASNPADQETLNLEREITELQRRFAEAAGEPVSFFFLPGLRLEDLPAAISRHQPDILHISAHGSTDALSLTNEAGNPIALDFEMLSAFLDHDRLPRLVYLNACDSVIIAERLKALVPMSIGMTAPISNRAARAGAVAFYERILKGASVQRAFETAQKMIEAQGRSTSAAIFKRDGVDPRREVLHRLPRVVAALAGSANQPGRHRYDVVFGLIGCPLSVTQVIFFTDEQGFIEDEQWPESDLCNVTHNRPSRATVWVDKSKRWEVTRDFRLFAVGVNADATTFSLASTLCDALEDFDRHLHDGVLSAEIAAIAEELRNGGAPKAQPRKERGRQVPASKVAGAAKSSAAKPKTRPGPPKLPVPNAGRPG